MLLAFVLVFYVLVPGAIGFADAMVSSKRPLLIIGNLLFPFFWIGYGICKLLSVEVRGKK